VPLPRRLILDLIWLISGKGQQWTDPTESDLILRDLWNAFPPDVTPDEIGLPTAIPLCVANPFPADGTSTSARRMRSHRHPNSTSCGPRSGYIAGPLFEEDIADQTIRTGSA